MKTIAVASLLIGLITGTAAAAQKPKNHVNAQAATEVMKLLDDYMAAWNQKDLPAWERTFHFPHYRLASGNMSVLERPGLQDATKVWASAGKD